MLDIYLYSLHADATIYEWISRPFFFSSTPSDMSCKVRSANSFIRNCSLFAVFFAFLLDRKMVDAVLATQEIFSSL